MQFFKSPLITDVIGLVAALADKASKSVNNVFTSDQTINGITVGRGAGTANASNTGVGVDANYSNTTGINITGVGMYANYSNTTGINVTGVGVDANYSNTTGSNLTGVGVGANYSNTTGSNVTGVGVGANRLNTTGSNLTGVGVNANYSNTIGSWLTGVGYDALRYKTDGSTSTNLNNITGIGANTRCSASNQVQLGDSATTTYVYGTVQNRSDLRDKADVQDTVLGLDFINALRPVDYRWDMRDDYLVPNVTTIPAVLGDDDEIVQEEYEVTTLVAGKRDGSKKRHRRHHGLIAQEVKLAMDSLGVDFGGYQDHSRSTVGSDVLTIGYDELIAPLIKAVQTLSARIVELESKVGQ